MTGPSKQRLRKQLRRVLQSLVHKHVHNRAGVGCGIGTARQRDRAEPALEQGLDPVPRPAQDLSALDTVGEPAFELDFFQSNTRGYPRALRLPLRIAYHHERRAGERGGRIEDETPAACGEPLFTAGIAPLGNEFGPPSRQQDRRRRRIAGRNPTGKTGRPLGPSPGQLATGIGPATAIGIPARQTRFHILAPTAQPAFL